MARKPDRPNGSLKTADYRHAGARRKNNPPAAIASAGSVPYAPKVRYSYSPHLPPVLRFDPTGAPDKLPDLVAEAGRRPLTEAEQRLLADALRTHEPWLEWAGKRESDTVSEGRGWFEVDPVALHIHERVSAHRGRGDRASGRAGGRGGDSHPRDRGVAAERGLGAGRPHRDGEQSHAEIQ